MGIPIGPIIMVAAPLARDLVEAIIDLAEASDADEVTDEQLDNVMLLVETKKEEVTALIEEIRRRRAVPGHD